jgi:ATP-dependent DNA helicase RecQ
VEREDATIAAQKVLSAMYRTGEKFGAAHLADVLTGANTEKIRQFNHNQLPTYGVGKDQPKAYWRNVINAIIAQGLAAILDPNRPSPKITNEGWKLLRNERSFQMLKQTLSKQSLIKAEKQRAAAVDSYSPELFQILRKLRTAIASAENVPPYIVFSDRTLQEMARDFPQSPDALLEINGVGQRKLENYGDQFLEAINEFVQTTNRK